MCLSTYNKVIISCRTHQTLAADVCWCQLHPAADDGFVKQFLNVKMINLDHQLNHQLNNAILKTMHMMKYFVKYSFFLHKFFLRKLFILSTLVYATKYCLYSYWIKTKPVALNFFLDEYSLFISHVKLVF